jgi:hypothetical protein
MEPSGTQRKEGMWVSSEAQEVPQAMWKIEFPFVLNSLFNFRMELPNSPTYLSITCNLF